MPGRDGRGPKGRRPMASGGGCYCLLKIPSLPDEPPTCFTGRAELCETSKSDCPVNSIHHAEKF